MIICHSHRFIFIKSRKTAGSSVEIALSRFCGPGDTVTPLITHLGEEDLRRAEGGYGPAGYKKALREYRSFREWRRLLTKGQRATRYGTHTTAAQLHARLPDDVWQAYTKISVERNPWDRAVSRYWWNKYRWTREGKWNFAGMTDLLQWLEREKPEQISNWYAYAINDRPAVDVMMFYETLSSDMAKLGRRLGVDADLRLPAQRTKSGYREARQHYTEVLPAEARAVVDRVCAKEIAYFGYRYGD